MLKQEREKKKQREIVCAYCCVYVQLPLHIRFVILGNCAECQLFGNKHDGEIALSDQYPIVVCV